METFLITYEFLFGNGKRHVYPLKVDKRTISLISERRRPLPAWTRLESCQCPPCPLTQANAPHCPIAANIAELIEDFKEIESTEHARITVHTIERTYTKEAPAQKGLSSIFGIIMATSNCPVMNFLKPMARYHLPFSTSEETIIRSISMYLLGQYFIAKRKGQPDLRLKNLERAYAMVQNVNRGICRRITSVIQKSGAQGDAASNAVVILDAFSHLLQAEIEGHLDSLSDLFGGNPPLLPFPIGGRGEE
jgi:hypothetical protein